MSYISKNLENIFPKNNMTLLELCVVELNFPKLDLLPYEFVSISNTHKTMCSTEKDVLYYNILYRV